MKKGYTRVYWRRRFAGWLNLPKALLAGASMLLLTGCGNQMFRQASYQPLDTPRALPPVGSVPVSVDQAPDDANAVISPADGSLQMAGSAACPSNFPAVEPPLPPPNLADNAFETSAPGGVSALKPPFNLDDSHIIYGGKVMFLNRCVQCHNAGGYGYGIVGGYLLPHPPDLASPVIQKKSGGAVFWAITEGEGKMPGFKNWATPSQRWALVAYTLSLGRNSTKGKDLLSAHVSDTTSAPYPVYGELGFEKGVNVPPFKVLGPAASSSASREYGTDSEPQVLTGTGSDQ